MKKTNFICILLFLLISWSGSLLTYGQKPDENLDYLHKIDRLKDRLKHEGYKPNGQADKYAVLISGKAELRYQANLSIAYQILLEIGFKRESIYILDPAGEDTYFYPVDGLDKKTNIRAVFESLAKRIDDQDLLFVYVTDHGNRAFEGPGSQTLQSILLVENSVSITQKEFFSYLSDINPRVGVLLFDQCFSGGFAKETGKGKFISIAASKADEISGSLLYNSFGGEFLKAFRNKNESDKNKDGKVSIQEEFAYAVKKDLASKYKEQTPMIVSTSIDPSSIFLQ